MATQKIIGRVEADVIIPDLRNEKGYIVEKEKRDINLNYLKSLLELECVESIDLEYCGFDYKLKTSINSKDTGCDIICNYIVAHINITHIKDYIKVRDLLWTLENIEIESEKEQKIPSELSIKRKIISKIHVEDPAELGKVSNKVSYNVDKQNKFVVRHYKNKQPFVVGKEAC